MKLPIYLVEVTPLNWMRYKGREEGRKEGRRANSPRPPAWHGMRRQLGEIALEFPIIPFLAFHCPIRAAAATNIPFVVSRLCQEICCTCLELRRYSRFFWWCYSIVPRSAAVFVQFCDNFTFLEFPSRRVWLDLKHRKKRRAKHFSRRTALAPSAGVGRDWYGGSGGETAASSSSSPNITQTPPQRSPYPHSLT